MAESFATMPDEMVLAAFQDAGMTEPGGANPLFPDALVTIKLGGDAALNDNSGTLVLPLPKIVLTIGSPYLRDHPYTAIDPNDTSGLPVAESDVVVPFTVWASSAVNLGEMRRRLLFARDHRAFLFGAHGMTLQGQMVSEKKRPLDPQSGLLAEDYRWHFFWSRP